MNSASSSGRKLLLLKTGLGHFPGNFVTKKLIFHSRHLNTYDKNNHLIITTSIYKLSYQWYSSFTKRITS